MRGPTAASFFPLTKEVTMENSFGQVQEGLNLRRVGRGGREGRDTGPITALSTCLSCVCLPLWWERKREERSIRNTKESVKDQTRRLNRLKCRTLRKNWKRREKKILLSKPGWECAPCYGLLFINKYLDPSKVCFPSENIQEKPLYDLATQGKQNNSVNLVL